MDKGERQALTERIAWLKYWGDYARWVVAARQSVVDQSQAARLDFEARSLTCAFEGAQVDVVPLNEVTDAPLMGQLQAAQSLRPLSSADDAALSIDSDDVRTVLAKSRVWWARAVISCRPNGDKSEKPTFRQWSTCMSERCVKSWATTSRDLLPATRELLLQSVTWHAILPDRTQHLYRPSRCVTRVLAGMRCRG